MTLNRLPKNPDRPFAVLGDSLLDSWKEERDQMWNAPIKTLQGQDLRLAAYRGKALLLVNVASQCGLTPQYSKLEDLQKKYEVRGFTVIGFPCNQFGGQEPGTAEEIQTFCAVTYGVTFPMMEKVEVNGPGRHKIGYLPTKVRKLSQDFL